MYNMYRFNYKEWKCIYDSSSNNSDLNSRQTLFILLLEYLEQSPANFKNRILNLPWMVPSTVVQINYSPTHLSGTYKLYRVSQGECARLREGLLYVKVYRYNPKHLYPKLNGYGDNGERSLKL
jgi:hypothetical protein